MTDHSHASAPFTESEIDELWATFGGDQRFESLQYSHAMRLAAFENAARVVSEMRRLRSGRWIEAAARDIATSPACGDIASSSATAIASVIRKHLAGGV
jgi:hypothetical protein